MYMLGTPSGTCVAATQIRIKKLIWHHNNNNNSNNNMFTLGTLYQAHV